ncbi:c-type cytochrome [Denitromonas iodatirespirans]|uniref:Cytochrome c n=1 Tax=Denitromonas iodatirespirans TaxID=2795389 RepID=A0A944D679_DENI1|nr:cytochrome c [Denitromonas iodatirespirans]MBT0960735.1 cytochrome c [Denitromonas iodatirespirans]
MTIRRSVWLAGLAAVVLPMSSAMAGDVAAGKEKSAVCAACHGQTGESVAPDFPKLAGQHEDYLLRALKDYKAGHRKNPIMTAQVENLSPADMADLAAYYAAQEGLYVKR